MEILSFIIIGIGIAFMLIGIVGIFQPKKDFYYRLLVACKVDTVGLLTVGIGLMIRHGFTFFSGKILLIIVIIMILNPLVAHIIAQAAYRSGYESICSDADAVMLEDGEEK
ncbi:MAG: monovalent cation/H(+) antiporter subunit G [Defluviitaleaceae bacterium]|nr:monovalent cation/H(+) antiporter subunit G [Defluviitaleaceae bacterium]